MSSDNMNLTDTKKLDTTQFQFMTYPSTNFDKIDFKNLTFVNNDPPAKNKKLVL